MLVPVPKLDSRKKRHAVAGDSWVPFSRIDRSIERPMVSDVRGIESGALVPFAIRLRVKIRPSVVGCRWAAVKIQRAEIRTSEPKRGHRPPGYDHDSNDRYSSAEEAQTGNNRVKTAESARPPQIADDSRRKKS